MKKLYFLKIFSFINGLVFLSAVLANNKDVQIRDPFEKSRNKIDVEQGLQTYSLDTLQLVGTLIQSGSRVAMMCDPEHHCHVVYKGDRVGQELAEVIDIQQDNLKVNWCLHQQRFTQQFLISSENTLP